MHPVLLMDIDAVFHERCFAKNSPKYPNPYWRGMGISAFKQNLGRVFWVWLSTNSTKSKSAKWLNQVGLKRCSLTRTSFTQSEAIGYIESESQHQPVDEWQTNSSGADGCKCNPHFYSGHGALCLRAHRFCKLASKPNLRARQWNPCRPFPANHIFHLQLHFHIWTAQTKPLTRIQQNTGVAARHALTELDAITDSRHSSSGNVSGVSCKRCGSLSWFRIYDSFCSHLLYCSIDMYYVHLSCSLK